MWFSQAALPTHIAQRRPRKARRWGEGDEAGSTNWYTQPEVVLRALAEVDQGKTYRLGHDHSADMPLFGARNFVLRIPARPTGGPLGDTPTPIVGATGSMGSPLAID